MVSKAVKEFQDECDLYKRNATVLACLNGEMVEVKNKRDVDSLVEELQGCGPHNGVVIGGCNPWYVSTVLRK